MTLASGRDRPLVAHATAALYGLAVGDALGMPTQRMSREEIRTRFGSIGGFLPAPPEHPLAPGMRAGSVTDDTEQALIVADLLIRGGGRVDPRELAERLVAWEDEMRRRGSLDLLGPSTKAAVAAILAGEPVESAGTAGTTNGAAMRVAPVGLAVKADDLDRLVDAVVEASLVSHNTSVAIAGASAVAAAVSTGVEGGTIADCLEGAVTAAALGARRGRWTAGGDVARRIRWAVSLADPEHPQDSFAGICDLIGTSLATQESVPAAFGILALFPEDGWAACCAAASAGGDTDTIAAMVGAMAGARGGAATFPDDAIATVRDENGLDLAPIAAALTDLR